MFIDGCGGEVIIFNVGFVVGVWIVIEVGFVVVVLLIFVGVYFVEVVFDVGGVVYGVEKVEFCFSVEVIDVSDIGGGEIFFGFYCDVVWVVGEGF